MKIITIIALVATGWLVRSIQAQGPDPNAPVGSTPRILADIAADRKEAEKKLNAALEHAVRAIESSDSITRDGGKEMVVRKLKESQAAWEQFRREQCAFLYSYYYEEIGSLGARAAGLWEYESRLIKQRIEELENPPNYF
jgi:uncharacterized protein YecT (DUF1311 family)